MTLPISSYRSTTQDSTVPPVTCDFETVPISSTHTQASKLSLAQEKVKKICKTIFNDLGLVILVIPCVFLTSSIVLIAGVLAGNPVVIGLSLPLVTISLVTISASKLYDIIKTKYHISKCRNTLPTIMDSIEKTRSCRQNIRKLFQETESIEDKNWDRLFQIHQEIVRYLQVYKNEIKDKVSYSDETVIDIISNIEYHSQVTQRILNTVREESPEQERGNRESGVFKRSVAILQYSIQAGIDYRLNYLDNKLEGLATTYNV